MFFDTLCVSFSFVFFKFLVFEAAIYANKDVYITLLLTVSPIRSRGGCCHEGGKCAGEVRGNEGAHGNDD